VFVVVFIRAIVAPSPILVLFLLFPLIKIAMLPAGFACPLDVETGIVVIPPVIVAVVRVIHAVAGARSTACDRYLRNQGCDDQEGDDETVSMANAFLLL